MTNKGKEAKMLHFFNVFVAQGLRNKNEKKIVSLASTSMAPGGNNS